MLQDDVAMWQGLSFGGDEVDSKFRKLMGIHGEEAAAQQPLTKQSVEQIKKQQELFEVRAWIITYIIAHIIILA